MDEKKPVPKQEEEVKWYSYVALLFAIIFFSGILATSKEWYSVCDFTVLNGTAQDGFAFALSLLPAVIFALAVVNVVEGLGGLKAAQKLLSPLLRPLLGIPGACGLGMIASYQSTDAGAGMIKAMYNEGIINEDEKTIFAMYQFSGDGTITNFFSSGAALFSVLVTPIILPFGLIMIFKFFGANLMRMYIKYEHKKNGAKEAA